MSVVVSLSVRRAFRRGICLVMGCVLFAGLMSGAQAGVYDTWGFRLKLSFTNQLGGPLTNFPVLVTVSTNLTGFRYAGFTNPDTGADLRFADAAETTPLNYEIDKWDTNGTSYVWVQVPLLSTTNDFIYAYWGATTNAPVCQTNGAVWTNAYVGVWHLAETSGATTAVDTTSNRNNGAVSASGVTRGSTGQVDGAFVFSGTGNLNCGTNASLDVGYATWEAWVYPTNFAVYENVIGKGYNKAYWFGLQQTTGKIRLHCGGGSGNAPAHDSAAGVASNQWTHIASTWDGQSVRHYINGVLDTNIAEATAARYNTGTNVHIGADFNNGTNGTLAYYFPGRLDEIRVSNQPRAPEWIYGCWLNQKSNSPFVTYATAAGMASALPASDVRVTSATLNGRVDWTRGAASPAVYFCWDYSDKGIAGGTGAWAHVDSAGSWAEGQTFSNGIVGLLSGSNYTYRCYTTNASGASWSDPQTFRTIYLPVVTNTGAVVLSPSSVLLQGTVSDTGGQTPGVWYQYWLSGGVTNMVGGGSQTGACSTTITGLLPTSNYVYRLMASNLAGVAYSATNGFRMTTVYYVATNGLDTGANDGLSWGKPFLTISNAVAKTVDKDMVLASNGVYTLGATITITNAITLRSAGGAPATTINGNGGVRCLLVTNLNAMVDGFTVTRGTVGGQGAGILCYGSVINCIVTGNTQPSGGSSDGGAGIYLGSGLVSNCTISANSAWNHGGGIRVAGAGGLVTHCRILNNYAPTSGSGSGSAASLFNGGTLRNCLIVGNWSDRYIGAVYLTGGGVMQNCTVAANTNPGVNAVDAGSTAVIVNSIIRDNIYPVSTPTNFGANTPTITYSCLEFPYTGTGNQYTNASFWDTAMTNYTLSSDSPCIDAGTNGSWTTGFDLAGNPRIANGRCDMGAYEYTVGALTCAVAALPTQGIGPLNVSLTAKAYGLNTSALYYRWSYTNSAVIDEEGTDKQVISRTYPPGLFTVTVTVSNQAGEVAQDSQLLKFSAPTCYVSKTGTHVYPFADWTTAATNVQSAVDAAVAGATVLLTNGWYTNKTVDLTVSDGIRITSVNGTGVTFIVGGGLRCVYLSHPLAVVERVTLKNGGNTGQGGCAYIRYGTIRDAVITGAALTGGGSLGGGGGVYMLMGTLSNCVVTANGNNNTAAGTGVRVAGNGLVTHCVIKNNVNSGSGTGVGIQLDAGTVRNSLIYSNYSASASPGVNLATGARMENCTVAGNQCPGSSAGALNLANGSIVVDSIVRDNIYTVSVPTNFFAATSPLITYSDLEFPWAGEGNLCTNAMFMDVAVGNFTLGESACVDAGTNLSWMTPGATDLAGQPRVSNTRPDMGAYEQTLGATFECSIVASPARGLSPLPVQLRAQVPGGNPAELYYRWSFTNAAVIDREGGADRQIVTNVYGPGSTTVTLIVSNLAGQVAQDTASLKISAPTCYVGRAGSSTPTFPYDTWATAATNIHDAMAEAVTGAVVMVTNGTYSVTQELVLAEAITVRSANGALFTTLDAGGGRRCFSMSDPGALVKGLTLSRGYDGSQGGGVYLSYGTVADCVITNGSVSSGGTSGGGGGIFVINGTVTNCVIARNSVVQHGGGVRMMGAGLVTHCIIASNRTTSVTGSAGQGGGAVVEGGTLRNCLIVGNVASNNGGGVSIGVGTMESCTVVSNTSAGTDGGGVRVHGSTTPTIINSIVRDNVYLTAVPSNFGAGTPVVSYSCLEFTWVGAGGNIWVDPQFMGAATGDYRPRYDSPCRNKGLNQAWMVGAVDLAGMPRIQVHVVDMGAYEALTPPGTCFTVR